MWANRTHLTLEPGLSPSFGVGATGSAYTTPSAARESMKDLARLQYIRGRFKYRLSFDAAESAAVVTVSIKNAGGTVLGSEQVIADGSQHYYGDFDVDLGDLSGSNNVYAAVTVDTIAGTATAAQLGGALDVEHPVILSGCN